MNDTGALVYVVEDDVSAREGVAGLIRSTGLVSVLEKMTESRWPPSMPFFRTGAAACGSEDQAHWFIGAEEAAQRRTQSKLL